MRFTLLFVLVVLIAGCSTTQRPVEYDTTNIRLERIERNILERNKEIEEIKYSIENLSNNMGKVDRLDNNIDIMGDDDIVSFGDDANDLLEGSSNKILRVPVSEKEVQIALKNSGYYDGIIDGKLGKKSVSAIKEFQKDFNLKVDGVVGRQTWSEMKKYLE